MTTVVTTGTGQGYEIHAVITPDNVFFALGNTAPEAYRSIIIQMGDYIENELLPSFDAEEFAGTSYDD